MTDKGLYSSGIILRYLLIIGVSILFLYFARTLFIPLFYGLFIAIVLYPICKWLEKHHCSRGIAISIGLLIIFVLSGMLLWLLIVQFNAFRSDLPELRTKLEPTLTQLQNWLEEKLNISIDSQKSWIKDSLTQLSDNPGNLLASSFINLLTGLFYLFIIPVFAALFIYNRKDFIEFLEKFAGNGYHGRLHLILNQTLNTYFHFIKGMIFVYIIVGVLNSIGLLALGIKHAILFGFITSIMTIIPYFGIFISALLPVTVAWITKDSFWYPVGVVLVFIFVQYLEANVIFPRVVASQLNVSTWATLIAIITGSIIWGASGMILFIPIVGILKIVSDHVPAWEPLNVLLRRRKS